MSACDAPLSLDDALESISVHPQVEPDDYHDITGWYPVSTDHHGGVVAYFGDETLAYAFRLFLINAALNPITFTTERSN